MSRTIFDDCRHGQNSKKPDNLFKTHFTYINVKQGHIYEGELGKELRKKAGPSYAKLR